MWASGYLFTRDVTTVTHKSHCVAGTRCSTDFAEVPSQFLEFFANDVRVLRQFARHHRTGEPISDELAANICASKKTLAAAVSSCDVTLSR